MGWEAMEGKTKASRSCGVQREEREEEEMRKNEGRGGGGKWGGGAKITSPLCSAEEGLC